MADQIVALPSTVTEAQIQNALDALPDGARLLLPANETIAISKGLVMNVAGRSITLDLNGSTLQQTGDVAVLYVRGGYSAAQSGTIPVGPGPQSPYTVAAQPPAGSCHYRFVGTHPLPDRACTPGATNPKVTQATLSGTICRSGYTSDIRPPVNITSREKRANAESYHYTGSLVSAEYDHLISLELGGDPNDPRNLWVEPNDNKSATSTHNDKDTVENRLHSAICANKVTLRAAQQAIVTDWTTALAVLKLG